MPRSRVIALHGSRDAHTFRFERAFKAIIGAHPAETWAVALCVARRVCETSMGVSLSPPPPPPRAARSYDVRMVGDFAERLNNSLHNLPTVQSIIISNGALHRPARAGRAGEVDEHATRTIVSDCPPWVKWLTFDNALSPDALREVALLLQVPPRGAGGESGSCFI